MPQAGTPKRQPSASPHFYSSHELREEVETEVSVLLLTVLKVLAGSALCLWRSSPGRHPGSRPPHTCCRRFELILVATEHSGVQDSRTDQLAQIPLSNGVHELPSEGLHSLHSNNMNEALLGPGSIGGRDGFHFQEPGQPSPDMPHHRRYGSASHQASKLCMLGGANCECMALCCLCGRLAADPGLMAGEHGGCTTPSPLWLA